MSKPVARWLRDITLGALLISGVAACTWQGIKRDDAGPRRLYISGHSAHVSDAKIARLAAPYLKSANDEVDLVALQNTLTNQPWLTHVRVSRHFPNGVVVHVADHRAVAYWGSDTVLAADGDVFRPEQRPAGLPSLSGPTESAEKVYAQYQALSGILRGQRAHLAALDLDANGNWQARLDDGLVLRLGREQMAQRMHRFVQFGLNRSAVQQALAKAGYVDLRYSDGFAVGGTRSPRHAAATGSEEKMG